MADKDLLKLDFTHEQELSRVLDRSCLLSSHQSHWRGIKLEVYRHPPFETPECTVLQHLITLPKGCKIEEIMAGKIQTAEFCPGDISFAPSGMYRQYRWQQEMETIHLVLEPEYVHHVAYEKLDPDKVELTSYFGKSDPLIYQIVLALIQELTINPTGSGLYAEAVATLLSIHLLRHYSTKQKIISIYPDGLSQSKLQTAIDYIQAHLNESISLEAIADQLGVSRYYFCHLFKQSMGISPYQYVIQQRVNYAKQLLQEGKLSISEIALASGFSHQSHLNYHFKKTTGLTPRQFLRSQ
ncbi:MAG: helix-turn-helix domain-containing protein [Thainema sp.]